MTTCFVLLGRRFKPDCPAYIEGVDDILVNVKPMLDRIGDWSSYLSKDDTTQEVNEMLNKHLRTQEDL